MSTGEAKTLELNGREFFVRTWGQPHLPKLILLHGFPEYSGAWAELAPKLSGLFHCIAPDQRGYGQSWAPADVGEYTISKLVGDIVALIDHPQIAANGPVTVFGHDWGAAVAYGLAMFHPDLVDRLIIANGVHPAPFQREMAAGGAQTEASQYIGYLRRDDSHDFLGANGCAKLLELFAAKMDMSWLLDNPERRAAYVAEWSRSGRLKGMTNWYRASPLALAAPGMPIEVPELPVEKLQIRCPHLLIWGLGDTALLPETTQGLEDFAPDLTRIEIKDADHWILHQQPDEVADAVLHWVTEGDQ